MKRGNPSSGLRIGELEGEEDSYSNLDELDSKGGLTTLILLKVSKISSIVKYDNIQVEGQTPKWWKSLFSLWGTDFYST